jgi:hypothetical protein
MRSFHILSLVACFALCLAACSSDRPAQVVELHHFTADNLDGIISRTQTRLDNLISSDGGGSLRIDADGPATIRLYELRNLDIEDARLIYRARLRTENVQGRAYLEMWCVSPQGEFFSRDLDSPLTGTNEWTTEETPFFIQKGQHADGVKLNLVMEGSGTVWIDDIRLLEGPLNP